MSELRLGRQGQSGFSVLAASVFGGSVTYKCLGIALWLLHDMQ